MTASSTPYESIPEEKEGWESHDLATHDVMRAWELSRGHDKGGLSGNNVGLTQRIADAPMSKPRVCWVRVSNDRSTRETWRAKSADGQ